MPSPVTLQHPDDVHAKQICEATRQISAEKSNNVTGAIPLSREVYDGLTDEYVKAMLAPAFQTGEDGQQPPPVYILAADDARVAALDREFKKGTAYEKFIFGSEAIPVLLQLRMSNKISKEEFRQALMVAYYKDWLEALAQQPTTTESWTLKELQKNKAQLKSEKLFDSIGTLTTVGTHVVDILPFSSPAEQQSFITRLQKKYSSTREQTQLSALTICFPPKIAYGLSIFLFSLKEKTDPGGPATATTAFLKWFGSLPSAIRSEILALHPEFAEKAATDNHSVLYEVGCELFCSIANSNFTGLCSTLLYPDGGSPYTVLPSPTLLAEYMLFLQEKLRPDSALPIKYQDQLGRLSAQDMLKADQSNLRLGALYASAYQPPIRAHQLPTVSWLWVVHDALHHLLTSCMQRQHTVNFCRHVTQQLTDLVGPALTSETWYLTERELSSDGKAQPLNILWLFLREDTTQKEISPVIAAAFVLNQSALLETADAGGRLLAMLIHIAGFSQENAIVLVDKLMLWGARTPQQDAPTRERVARLLAGIACFTLRLAPTIGDQLIMLADAYPQFFALQWYKTEDKKNINVKVTVGTTVFDLANETDQKKLGHTLTQLSNTLSSELILDYLKERRPVNFAILLKATVQQVLANLPVSSSPVGTLYLPAERDFSDLQMWLAKRANEIDFVTCYQSLQKLAEARPAKRLPAAFEQTIATIRNFYACYKLSQFITEAFDKVSLSQQTKVALQTQLVVANSCTAFTDGLREIYINRQQIETTSAEYWQALSKLIAGSKMFQQSWQQLEEKTRATPDHTAGCT